MSLRRMAWRNLGRRKLRTFLTILSIVIGVASTFAVIAAVDTAKDAFPLYLKESLGRADFQVSGTDAYFPEDVHAQLQGIPDAVAVSALAENAKIEIDRDDIGAIQRRVLLKGYSDLGTPLTGYSVLDGEITNHGAVITDRTAKVWNVGAGDTITLETDGGAKQIEISAVVRYTADLMGPSSWGMAKYHPWTIAMPQEMLQAWYGLEGQIQTVQIKALAGADLDALGRYIDGVVTLNGNIYMQPVVVDLDLYMNQSDSFFLALYIAGLLGIALSAFIIFNSLYVSVNERRNEFAALKTIGYSSEQLRTSVLYEAAMMAVIGTLIGLGVGYGMAVGLKTLIFMMFGVYADTEMELSAGIAASGLAGLAIPMLASLVPIRCVDKLSVVGTLKDDNAPSKPMPAWRWIAGLALIACGFFIKHLLVVVPILAGVTLLYPFLFAGFVAVLNPIYRLLFPFAGNIAIGNLRRNMRRSSMTSVILSLGIAMIVLMSSLNSALIQTYERVIYSSYGGNLDIMFHHIEEEDLSVLQSLDGVADATTYRSSAVVWSLEGERRKLPLYGVGADWIDRFPLFAVAGDTKHSELIGGLRDGEIVLDRVSYGVWGGEVGGRIELETLDGMRAFTVKAVVDSMKNSGYGAFMGTEQFEKHFGVKYERNALVLKEESASPLQLRENVFDAFGERIEEMFGPEDWVTVISSTYTGSFTIINTLIVLSIVISAIGITNTLLMNIMERVRELGTMRAVGVTRRQVHRLIVLEGFGIGLAATVIGSVFGILMIYLTSTFFEMNSLTFGFGVSPLMIGISCAFGLAVSLIASFTPAARASNTRLSEALKYE